MVPVQLYIHMKKKKSLDFNFHKNSLKTGENTTSKKLKLQNSQKGNKYRSKFVDLGLHRDDTKTMNVKQN